MKIKAWVQDKNDERDHAHLKLSMHPTKLAIYADTLNHVKDKIKKSTDGLYEVMKKPKVKDHIVGGLHSVIFDYNNPTGMQLMYYGKPGKRMKHTVGLSKSGHLFPGFCPSNLPENPDYFDEPFVVVASREPIKLVDPKSVIGELKILNDTDLWFEIEKMESAILRYFKETGETAYRLPASFETSYAVWVSHSRGRNYKQYTLIDYVNEHRYISGHQLRLERIGDKLHVTNGYKHDASAMGLDVSDFDVFDI